jgi:hypothetical protein
VPEQYLSASDIGALLGVSASAVKTWRLRHPGFPAPDALTGRSHPVAGWLPSRIPEIRAWRATLPGRGAGGGRPRKDITTGPR